MEKRTNKEFAARYKARCIAFNNKYLRNANKQLINQVIKATEK